MGSLKPFYEEQLALWQDTKQRFDDLRHVEVKQLGLLKAQFNPARLVSTGAKIDKATLAKRPCFLCAANRPKEQIVKDFNSHFDILINPFPILPEHFTIPSCIHELQQIKEHFIDMLLFIDEYDEGLVFYNGPRCGASAPDHLHFQAGTKSIIPMYQEWENLSSTSETILSLSKAKLSYITHYACPVIAITSYDIDSCVVLFNKIYDALPLPENDIEPMMNVVVWKEKGELVVLIFPRFKHRPDCYFAEGNAQCLVSPGAIDMAGLLILPLKKDFDTITLAQASAILKEVTLPEEVVVKVLDTLRKH